MEYASLTNKEHFKGTIVLDCDDVLAVCKDEIYKALCQELSLPEETLHFDNWHSWELENIYDNLKWTNLHAWLIENDSLLKMEPELGASTVTQYLSSIGYKITLVTARGDYPNGMKHTIEWLDRHDVHIDEVYCVCPTSCKSDVISTLGPVECICR